MSDGRHKRHTPTSNGQDQNDRNHQDGASAMTSSCPVGGILAASARSSSDIIQEAGGIEQLCWAPVCSFPRGDRRHSIYIWLTAVSVELRRLEKGANPRVSSYLSAFLVRTQHVKHPPLNVLTDGHL